MAYLTESWRQLAQLASAFDREVLDIVLLSFRISSTAVFLSSLISLPLSLVLALKDFPGRRVLVSIFNSLLAVPAVAIGLIVYLLLSRQGPLGAVGLLYTPWAMVAAQTLLAIPILTSLSLVAFQSVSKKVRETALTLGANVSQLIATMFKESRYGLMAALIMAFARLVGETGMTMMVGGNIAGSTRVMTTAIALETMKGRFELAIILGIILLITCGVISVPLQLLQGTGRR